MAFPPLRNDHLFFSFFLYRNTSEFLAIQFARLSSKVCIIDVMPGSSTLLKSVTAFPLKKPFLMAHLAIKSRLVFHLACGAAALSADLNHVSCSSLTLLLKVSNAHAENVHTQFLCTWFCKSGSVCIKLQENMQSSADFYVNLHAFIIKAMYYHSNLNIH